MTAAQTAPRLFDPDVVSGKIYSGGWVDGAEVVDVIEPATGESLGRTGLGSAALVARATEAAAAAQREWVRVPAEQKRELFIRAADVMRAFGPEYEEWMIREVGSPRVKVHFEIEFLVDEFLEAAAYPTQMQGMVLADRDHRLSYSRRIPHGVVAGITPSNVPLILGSRFIAPALAMGNAVVLKPHRSAIMCSGMVFARILEEAGFPDGLFHCIPVEGPDAAVFETDPHIGMVHFTGSTITGRKVAEAASRNLKKVSISASGKNPFIVLDDVPDFDTLMGVAINSSYLFSGQVCMAAGRYLIQRPLHDRFVDALVERAAALVVDDPWTNPKSYYGPMTLPGAVDRMQQIVDDAVAKGATVRLGGKKNGPYFPPTVLTGVGPGMRAWDEEIFGPIAPIRAFDTDDEALALANDNPYGLCAGVYGSVGRAHQLAQQVEAGMVHVNANTRDDCAYVPFGGVKGSGNGGRYGSYVNWDEYTQTKWITVASDVLPIPGH